MFQSGPRAGSGRLYSQTLTKPPCAAGEDDLAKYLGHEALGEAAVAPAAAGGGAFTSVAGLLQMLSHTLPFRAAGSGEEGGLAAADLADNMNFVNHRYAPLAPPAPHLAGPYHRNRPLWCHAPA